LCWGGREKSRDPTRRSVMPRSVPSAVDRLRLDPGLDFIARDEGLIEMTEAGVRRMVQAHSAGLDAVIGINDREVLRFLAPKRGPNEPAAAGRPASGWCRSRLSWGRAALCCSYPNKPRTTAAQKTTPTPTKQKAAIRSLHAVCFATRSVSVKAVSSPRPESRASTKILLMIVPQSRHCPRGNCHV
jgi:hypothetical protein